MNNIEDTKLLVVGAGGIGCELLKNLILTGFKNIEVIDLDTIELSNLNRQFLFQKCHVGKPKAIIARESVLKYNPEAHIVAHHDSIMNVRFGVDYFKQFAIVLNALDNKAARSHVNRLCLAAEIPLIESGSAGYLGQITFIKRSVTECYDCLPKPPVKSFPGCTIRNTPSEPIHCIVWAKHLFNQLFGAEDPDEAVSPDGEDPENMADAGKATMEKSESEEAVVRHSTRQWAKETNYDSVKIFNKLFSDDIKYLLSMSKLWEKRKAPQPINWDESIVNSAQIEQLEKTNRAEPSNQLESHKILTIKDYAQMFSDSVCLLQKRLDSSNDSNPILVWDKDDEDAMNFVTSASNLRCFIFSIGLKSKFETKSLAGSIIPAIATTNAIVAGLIVLEALKVINNKSNECKTVYLRDKPSNNKLIVSSELVKPNDKCYVCASKPEICIKLNCSTFTVKQFEQKILKQELNMVQPDVEIDDGTGRIIISSEEGETEENNDKPLGYFGLTDQSAVKCDDFFQNFQLRITILQCDKFDVQNTKEYEIVSQNQMLKDLQDQLQKEKETVTHQAVDETSNTFENKKRQYQTAFEEDSESASSIKKLKPLNSEVEQEIICEESNSINDASDAISDEDETVQPKSNLLENNSSNSVNNREEILVEDDDCLIEENSNESKQSLKRQNNQSNGFSNDDDVIECSSEDDIIEINENDINSNDLDHSASVESASSSSSNYKKIKLQDSSSSNGNHEFNNNKRNSLTANNIGYHQNGDHSENGIKNGVEITTANTNSSNDDEAYTVIE